MKTQKNAKSCSRCAVEHARKWFKTCPRCRGYMQARHEDQKAMREAKAAAC